MTGDERADAREQARRRAEERVIFPPSSVAGLAAIRYRVEPVQCPVVGSSDVGYCRCVLVEGHESYHACQHEIWQ